MGCEAEGEERAPAGDCIEDAVECSSHIPKKDHPQGGQNRDLIRSYVRRKTTTNRRGIQIMRIATVLAIAVLGTSSLAFAQHAQAAVQHYQLNIPRQNLDLALKDLAQQTGLQIGRFSGRVDGSAMVGPIKGNQTPEQALKALLYDTGLNYKIVNDTTIAIYNPEDPMPSAPGLSGSGSALGVAGESRGEGLGLKLAQSESSFQPRPQSSALGTPVTQSNLQPGPQVKQTQEESLQEIVVTATKRQENLKDVPASIEVVTGQELQNTDIQSVLDLSRAVPSFNVNSAGSLFSTLYIRGIGTNSNGYDVQPSVSTVIDGVVIARTGGTVLTYEDIARVEVLRGPQGTLFGKNSSAGALNIVTNDPTSTPSANLGVSYGSYHDVRVDGVLSGPLVSDVLEGRIAFVNDNRDGYTRNLFNGSDLNSDHQAGVRGKLLFTPMSGTRVLLSADYASQNGSCCAEPLRLLTASANVAERGLYPGFTYPPGFVAENNAEVDMARQPTLSNKSYGSSLQWDQEIGDFTLTSITAYRQWNAVQNQAQFNTTPITQQQKFVSTINQDQTSEEFRLTSPKGKLVDYVVGLFYYDDAVRDNENWLLDLAPLTGLPQGTAILPADYTSNEHTSNYAGFGEANVHVSDRITFIAGARETFEGIKFNLGGLALGGVPVDVGNSHSVNNFSWRLGTRWEIDSSHMVYATVSTGFKGAAYNGNSGDLQRADPEKSISYETGWKGEFLDGRVRTNLALFFTNLNHFQTTGVVSLPELSVVEQLLVNAGQLRSKGVEWELNTLPTENLTLNLNAAYTDAQYSDFRNAPCYPNQTLAQGCINMGQDLTGVTAPLVPRLAFNMNSNYDIVLPTLPFNAFVRADYAWKSKVQWDATNNPATLEPAYGVLGAGLGIKSKDGRYTLTAYGRNLTDEFHTAGIIASGSAIQFLQPDYERTWGIRMEARF
jgi:iron complex outermembrane recepter protein